MARLIFIGAFLVWALFVTASDIRCRRISNALAVTGGVVGYSATFLYANPFNTFPIQAMTGMSIGLIAFFPFFMLRVMGAADVKVFAVLGVWCGVHALLWLWIVASLAAGVHALGLMLLSRTSFSALWRRGEFAVMLGRYRATPYAACLAAPAAAWLVYRVATGGTQ